MDMKSSAKLKTRRERVGSHGEIKIPQDFIKTLGLEPGKEIALKPMGDGFFVEPIREATTGQKPRKSPVDELSGILGVSEPEFVDELLETEDVLSL